MGERKNEKMCGRLQQAGDCDDVDDQHRERDRPLHDSPSLPRPIDFDPQFFVA